MNYSKLRTVHDDFREFYTDYFSNGQIMKLSYEEYVNIITGMFLDSGKLEYPLQINDEFVTFAMDSILYRHNQFPVVSTWAHIKDSVSRFFRHLFGKQTGLSIEHRIFYRALIVTYLCLDVFYVKDAKSMCNIMTDTEYGVSILLDEDVIPAIVLPINTYKSELTPMVVYIYNDERITGQMLNNFISKAKEILEKR